VRPPLFRFCLLLSQQLCRRDPLVIVREAVAEGVDCVQLREKEMTSAEMYAWGKELKAVTDELGVPLVVNDSVEVAMALGARGVHLGQDDMHPDDARKLVGADFWIGLSTHDLEQMDEAAELEVDYAGFGPVFATETKGYSQGLGPEFLAAAVAIARVPVVAIGGIQPETVRFIPEQCGIAVSSAICCAPKLSLGFGTQQII